MDDVPEVEKRMEACDVRCTRTIFMISWKHNNNHNIHVCTG